MTPLKKRLSYWIGDAYYRFNYQGTHRVSKAITVEDVSVNQVTVYTTCYTTVFVITLDDRTHDKVAVVRCGADDRYKFAIVVPHDEVLAAVRLAVDEDRNRPAKELDKLAIFMAQLGKIWDLLPTS